MAAKAKKRGREKKHVVLVFELDPPSKFGFDPRTETVVYRGVKIEPPMVVGKRSPRARAIREDILGGVMAEYSRGKSR